MREDLRTYYFTYGDDPEQPFCGGWTEVRARNMSEAVCLFREKHPDKLISKEAGYFGLLNCAFVYTEDQFKDTTMYTDGNRGFRCHERINSLVNFLTQKQSIIDKVAELTETFQAAVRCCVANLEEIMEVLEEDGTQSGDISS